MIIDYDADMSTPCELSVMHHLTERLPAPEREKALSRLEMRYAISTRAHIKHQIFVVTTRSPSDSSPTASMFVLYKAHRISYSAWYMS